MNDSSDSSDSSPRDSTSAESAESKDPEPKRYRVTIERELILYADSPEWAEQKAMAYLKSITREEPASRPMKVVEVVELAPVLAEGVGKSPEIDISPVLQRKTHPGSNGAGKG